jgi:hypothetical protein
MLEAHASTEMTPLAIRLRHSLCIALLVPALVACTTPGERAQRPAHTVHAVGKVVDSLAAEVARRLASDAYRGLPVVVTASGSNGMQTERIVAEFLRTRLRERAVPVHVACAGRCMEVGLQEFAIDTPGVSQLTPGQILTVAAGSVPVLGSMTRSFTDRERERERAAARSTGLLVTFAARDGNSYVARSHVVAIVSTSSGDVALEQR